MNKKIQKLYRSIITGNVEQNFYEKNKELINETNYRTALSYSFFAFGFCLICFLGSCLTDELKNQVEIYMVFTLVFGTELEAALLLIRKKLFLVRAYYYLVCISIYIFTIYVGVFQLPHSPSVAFFIASIVLPIPLIEKPIYSIFMTLGANIVFIACVFWRENGFAQIVKLDLIHAVAVTFLSCAFVVFTKNMLLENIQAKQLFARKAQIDKLTGVYNKETAEQLAADYILSMKLRGEYSNFALFIIDMDNFKEINDKKGHLTGDTVLEQVGKRLRTTFRSEDIVGRIGGDEFIVIMKEVGNRKLAEERAQMLIARVSEDLRELIGVNSSVSVGIVMESCQNTSYQDAFKKADMALYQAKEKGKKQFVIIDALAPEKFSH